MTGRLSMRYRCDARGTKKGVPVHTQLPEERRAFRFGNLVTALRTVQISQELDLVLYYRLLG